MKRKIVIFCFLLISLFGDIFYFKCSYGSGIDDLFYDFLIYKSLNPNSSSHQLGLGFSIANYTNIDPKDLANFVMKYMPFCDENFRGAYFNNRDLRNKNFSGKFFCYARFKHCKLDGANVKNANFAHAKGLSNLQKDYLRKNGALNIPIDIEYDLDDSGVGTEVKKVRFHKRLFRRFIMFYRWLRRLDKNTEIQVNEKELEPLSSES